MSLLRLITFRKQPDVDADALVYIDAVEQADGQSLEPAVKLAINSFVIECKQTGIWDAIKSSCILAGARTLNGALIPLTGLAPTNYNFQPNDYNRKTGLQGGASKFLNSNRNNNSDPQDSFHMSVYASSVGSSGYAIAVGAGESGSSMLGLGSNVHRNRSATFVNIDAAIGFNGQNRASSTNFIYRRASTNITVNVTSQSPFNGDLLIFARGTVANPAIFSNGRLAFYSIGQSLNLALLDLAVTKLIDRINNAIVP